MPTLRMDYEMDASHGLPALILAKLHEQVDRTEHMLTHIPADQLEWRPEWPTPEPSQGMHLSRLLGHLLTCLKYQLFAYLKVLGVPLGTRDLYVWRGR